MQPSASRSGRQAWYWHQQQLQAMQLLAQVSNPSSAEILQHKKRWPVWPSHGALTAAATSGATSACLSHGRGAIGETKQKLTAIRGQR